MARAVKPGLAEGDQHFALRAAGAGDPPLVAVDDVLVGSLVVLELGGDVRGIGGSHTRLSHRVCGADLTAQQGLKPLLLLLGGAELLNHLHVAGVGGRAVHSQVGDGESAHDLANGAVLHHGEATDLGQEEVGQPTLFSLAAQLVQDSRLLRDEPTPVGTVFLESLRRVREMGSLVEVS